MSILIEIVLTFQKLKKERSTTTKIHFPPTPLNSPTPPSTPAPFFQKSFQSMFNVIQPTPISTAGESEIDPANVAFLFSSNFNLLYRSMHYCNLSLWGRVGESWGAIMCHSLNIPQPCLALKQRKEIYIEMLQNILNFYLYLI